MTISIGSIASKTRRPVVVAVFSLLGLHAFSARAKATEQHWWDRLSEVCPVDGRLVIAGSTTLARLQALQPCAKVESGNDSPDDLGDADDTGDATRRQQFPLTLGQQIPQLRSAPTARTSHVREHIAPNGMVVVTIAPPPEADSASRASRIFYSPRRVSMPLGQGFADCSGPGSHIGRLVANSASRHQVDPLLLHAVMQTESCYAPRAVSRAGAIGLMQIMPQTGVRLGASVRALYEPATNIDVGTRLLKRLLNKFSGDFSLTLAAYNAGEGAVERYRWTVPPYRETISYVRQVLARYDRMENAARGQSLGAGRSQ